MSPLLEVEGLTVCRTDGAPIIEDISLSLGAGEVLGIVGESGSGKSTLALALLGYAQRGVRIVDGVVRVEGTDLLALDAAGLRKARRELVAYVAQDPGSALNPMMSLATLLTAGIEGSRTERIAKAREILRKVGLPDDDGFLARKPRQLSGGQQQRIAIAMAVIARPKVIILDEPTTGLDVSTRSKVLELVRQLCVSDSLAAIYVSHDLAVIAHVADRITVMYGGQVVEQGRVTGLLQQPRHPYTRALLGAVPSLVSRQQPRPIRGRVPPVGERSAGCIFSSRCDHVVEACAVRPALTSNGSSQVRCVRPDLPADASPADMTFANSPLTPPVRPVLESTGINAFYGSKQVLFDVSLSVRPGHCLAIVGESGSGKSTLSRSLIGLHENASGLMLLDGEPLPLQAARRDRRARQRLQYVFQNPNASLNPRRTIGASLEAALIGRSDKGEVKTRVASALDRVGIGAEFASRYPAELSGGQRQRVAIARALLAEPAVLLCDEVTSSLDVSVQASMIDLLRSLVADGLAMIFVTHDLAVVRNIADSVMVLNAGRVVEQGSISAVLESPRHAYTRMLLSCTLQLPVASEPSQGQFPSTVSCPAAATRPHVTSTVQQRGEEHE